MMLLIGIVLSCGITLLLMIVVVLGLLGKLSKLVVSLTVNLCFGITFVSKLDVDDEET